MTQGFDIDELERLLAAATPGEEWCVVRYGDGDSLVICEDEAGNQRVAFMAVPGCRDHLARKRAWKEIKANAALIVAAHNSLPAILTEIRELRATVAALGDSARAGANVLDAKDTEIRELRAENARLKEALDEDELESAITDSIDLDWQPRWAAQEIRRRAALGEPQ